MLRPTVGDGVRLHAVHHVRVRHEEADNLPAPLVPEEHAATVTATQHPLVPPEVGLLDLQGGGGGDTVTHRETDVGVIISNMHAQFVLFEQNVHNLSP